MAGKVFFDKVRDTVFGGQINTGQVDGCNTIIDACAGNMDLRWVAYCLATAYHETAHTMQPIAEYGHGRGHPYGRPGSDGQCAYGRGFVQLTWHDNYVKADNELSLRGKLIRDYDLALEPNIAARVLIYGLIEGWFTRFKLVDYFNDNVTDWVHARRIVNGMDKAELIAGYARHFYEALETAKYSASTGV